MNQSINESMNESMFNVTPMQTYIDSNDYVCEGILLVTIWFGLIYYTYKYTR